MYMSIIYYFFFSEKIVLVGEMKALIALCLLALSFQGKL